MCYLMLSEGKSVHINVINGHSQRLGGIIVIVRYTSNYGSYSSNNYKHFVVHHYTIFKNI